MGYVPDWYGGTYHTTEEAFESVNPFLMSQPNGGDDSLVSPQAKASNFAQRRATQPLRICCFGSSSSQTPRAYLRPSAEVGYLLAVRGHTCVNGAGSFGCMAALNEGAVEGNGHIVGVIHEMWLKEGEDVKKNAWGLQRPLRDSGAHTVFTTNQEGKSIPEKEGEMPVRELLVAGGKDLQERKKLLIQDADGLIVMPGGPGTFDELWEMACARNIGLSSIPIVCVNINGFYDPFRNMLDRAWTDNLTKLLPEQIIHMADTAEEAVQWIENVHDDSTKPKQRPMPARKKEEALRTSSVIGTPQSPDSLRQRNHGVDIPHLVVTTCFFAIGVVTGTILAAHKGKK